MELREYFEQAKGMGVLATADAKGRVDAAIFSRPHVLEDNEVAFIMADRLTHDNVTTNPHATYLFREDRPGYTGKRLFLKKTREEKNSEKLQTLVRRFYPADEVEAMKPLYLVYFKVEQELPLIGD